MTKKIKNGQVIRRYLKKLNKRYQWGAILLTVIYGLLFFALFFRFFQIQATGVARGEQLKEQASARHEQYSIIQANRGEILDRNNKVIASDTLSYRIAAVTSEDASENADRDLHVVDPKKTAEVLARHLSLSEEEIEERLRKGQEKKLYQVEFGVRGRDLSHAQVKALRKDLEEAEIYSIRFTEEKKRFYPNNEFASHLIGYAAEEEIEKEGTLQRITVGKMGLEKTFDEQLSGKNGSLNFERDRWGYLFPQKEKVVKPAQDGYNIQLTLEQTIQNLVENEMTEVYKQYNPVAMTLVLADAKTGEILAMSQRPTFDPATREGLSTNWLNEAVEKTIEPGSTMKMFTLAAAIEEGKWRPNDYFKSGQYKVYDRVIRDVNKTGWGTISFLEGFQRSSNVSMAYLLERIGDKRFIEYVHDFGFGQPVGIDLPGEASGIILDTYPAERLTTSYGQGSTVTPIQMIQAATAIANDGKMMKPYLIRSIIDPNKDNKVILENKPEQKGMPISAETAKQVREVLATTVTAPHGTGQPFALGNYDVGGKTGTAQIPKKDGSGYIAGRGQYLYSFLGMAPIDDPKLIMFVSIQQPTLPWNEYGGIPVAKLFTAVMNNSLKHLNVKPKEVPVVEAKTMPDVKGQSVEEAMQTLAEQGFVPTRIGDGEKVVEQYPSAEAKLPPKSHVLVKAEGLVTLPDFTGWSKKMMLSYKALSNLDIRMSGEGYVVAQSISSGAVVPPDEPIMIQLESPAVQYEQKINYEENEGEE